MGFLGGGARRLHIKKKPARGVRKIARIIRIEKEQKLRADMPVPQLHFDARAEQLPIKREQGDGRMGGQFGLPEVCWLHKQYCSTEAADDKRPVGVVGLRDGTARSERQLVPGFA